jgi:hypothetical protein
VGAWALAVLVALLPMPRNVRYRLRLAAPAAAGHADRLAGAALPMIVVAVLVLVAAAIPPGTQPSLRLWAVGAAIGLVTGIPFALERRSLRRRIAGLPPLPDPDPGADPGPDGLRSAALVAARAGRSREARLDALRAAQVDSRRWDVLLDTGAALCRRGRFADGIRLLERGADLSGRTRAALLLLAAGNATAGRLREAAAAMDECDGISGRRRG